MIKAVIFDCFGTLVQPGRNLLYRRYPEFSNDIEDLEHQWHLGMISRSDFDSKVGELISLPASEVRSRYYSTTVRDEAAIEWVKSIKQAGKYKVGLLSNVGLSRFNDFFDKNEQAEMFDDVVLSCEVGIVKPEVAIFELAANRLGVKPGECVMVDDIQLNIDAANDAGMKGILFITPEQSKRELALIEETDA